MFRRRGQRGWVQSLVPTEWRVVYPLWRRIKTSSFSFAIFGSISTAKGPTLLRPTTRLPSGTSSPGIQVIFNIQHNFQFQGMHDTDTRAVCVLIGEFLGSRRRPRVTPLLLTQRQPIRRLRTQLPGILLPGIRHPRTLLPRTLLRHHPDLVVAVLDLESAALQAVHREAQVRVALLNNLHLIATVLQAATMNTVSHIFICRFRKFV